MWQTQLLQEEHRGNPWLLLMWFTGMKPRLYLLTSFSTAVVVCPAVVFGDIFLIGKITSLALVEEIEVWQVHLVLFAAQTHLRAMANIQSCSGMASFQRFRAIHWKDEAS